MQTLQQVKAQIARIPSDGRYIFWTDKEVRYLPKILGDNEQVLALTSGFVGNNTWLLVCTDERIIFLDRGWLYGVKQIQIPLARVNSIDHEIGFTFGSISVWDGATRMTMGMILRNKVAYFVNVAKRAIEDYNQRMAQRYMQQHAAQQQQQPQSQATPATPPPPQLTPEQQTARLAAMADHLERLAKLRDNGILTDEEFQKQKTTILQQTRL